MTIFELFGTIAIKNSEANKSIEETTGKAEELGKQLGGAGESADGLSGKFGQTSKFNTAAVFMGQMLYGLTEKAANLATTLAKTGISFASDMEQNIGGVETLFGDAAEIVFKNADQAYKTAGMSANDYMETVTGFAAALKQSTQTEAEAAKIADMAIIDMSDNANKMGTDMSMIQNAYQGFAKQNFMMLDNLKLGYGGTQGEMERLLEDAMLLTGKAYNISNLADIFEAIHAIQVELGIAGTTAEEASTTLSGSAGSAKSAWENLLSNAMLEAIPKLTELINKIMEWVQLNPEKVQQFSDAITNIATVSFDAMLNGFQWLTSNGESVGTALTTIATAMAVAAVAAHPYAAAVTAVVAALAYLNSETGKKRGEFTHVFDGYSEENLQTLQNWVDAANEAKRAEDAYMNSLSEDDYAAYDSAWRKADAMQKEVEAIDGLLDAYRRYETAQGTGSGNEMHIDVPLQVSEDSEGNMQDEINGMSLESIVNLVADTSGLQAAVNATKLTSTVQVFGTGGTVSVDGSHASGLDRVPRDGYLARVHKDEAILDKTDASIWRGGGANRVEALLSQVVTLLAQQKNIVLDSGVMVGQLAPAMDARLGTIGNRKGRGN